MTTLKDELIEATGLPEEKLKAKLLAVKPSSREAERAIEANAVKTDTLAYITLCYASSDYTLRDRMLKAIK